MDALAAKINEEFRPVETFVDLNWPRVNWWDPTDFPSFVRLHKAIAERTFDTVFIDLESGDPRNWAPYDSIVPHLRHSGARIFNAHYDDEDALKNEIGRKYGPSAREVFFTGPGDASDIVAFFPALASAVALEALDEDDRYDARWEPLLRDIRRLGDESPYASSGYPFIDPRLERKMIDRKIKDEEADRAKRRKFGERQFRIDRDSPPLLIDEHAWGAEPRSEEHLQWAEARLES
jgi:hypothetical protein